MTPTIVGGRPFEFTKEQVNRRMKDEQEEPIREHLVEVAGKKFPPKQVLATVTGWDRLSFTTLEAQRVLRGLGFVCRRVGDTSEETRQHAQVSPTDTDRLKALEAGLTVANEAIASLAARVAKLEGGANHDGK